jgi:hypothetical protein
MQSSAKEAEAVVSDEKWGSSSIPQTPAENTACSLKGPMLEWINGRTQSPGIHNHWLRQECKNGTIQLQWEPTSKMIADGLTKALSKQKFAHFVKLLRLEDQTQRLRLIQREEELRDELKAKRQAIQNELEVRYRASSRE